MNDLSLITTYQAGVVQAAAHRALQKQCDAILKPYGITKMQWLIIGTVLDSGKKGVRISDLARDLGTTMGYLTNNLKVLELRGIVMRRDSGSDNRSRLVVIDPSYASKCQEIETALRDGLRKSIYARVDPDEFRTYMKVLYELKSVGTKSQ